MKNVHEEFADLPETWEYELCETCYKIPKYWCCAFWCPCCMAYKQRTRLLDDDMSRYKCCQGQVCGPCTEPTDGCVGKCPELCLITEILCCFWCSIGTNRAIIQRTYRIANSWLDNALIWFACIASWVICIISIFISIPQEVAWLIDCLYAMFQSCLQSQQENEMDKRQFRRGGDQMV